VKLIQGYLLEYLADMFYKKQGDLENKKFCACATAALRDSGRKR